MARTQRSAKLDSRSARLKLRTEQRHQEPLSPGRYLVYRRPKKGGDGSWFAYWYGAEQAKKVMARLGTADDYTDADGLKVFTHAQAQVRANEFFKRQDYLAIHGTEAQVEQGPLTVNGALDRYLAFKEQEGSKSAKDMRLRTDLWIRPTLGTIEVTKLTREKIRTWHLEMAATTRRKRPCLKPHLRRKPKKAGEQQIMTPTPISKEEALRRRKASANRVLATLKAALTLACQEGWVVCPMDPWRLVKPFRQVDEPRQSYLSAEDQQRLINAIKDPHFGNLVRAALLTGCRYGELCRMKVADFNDATGPGSVSIWHSKSGKSRHVVLLPGGKEFFSALVAGRPSEDPMFLREGFDGRKWKEGRCLRPWKQSEQQRPMAQACEAAGIPSMGFHQLRHSYASALVKNGVSLFQVSKLTGHADTRMLERHYAHLAQSDLAEVLMAKAPRLELGTPHIAPLKIKTGA